jgi:hypothetical protein
MMQIESELMTVGQLSRRTGLSIKAIGEYEAVGLIYSAGRSEGNFAISNWLLRRDDQLGCIVFASVDLAESRPRRYR